MKYNKDKTAYLYLGDWILLGRGQTEAPGALVRARDKFKEFVNVRIVVREGDRILREFNQEQADWIDEGTRQLLLDAHVSGVYLRILRRVRERVNSQIRQKENDDDILAVRMYSEFKEKKRDERATKIGGGTA